ncbi:MAG: HTH-type transcriptional regulator/antitoxin HigA [Cyclobacteriaceae bacterium]|jgi:HTH-type transcriptional regulator/antitoxin HigA
MESQQKHPGVALRDLLVSKSISQRELASLIQIAHSNLHNILSGERSISAEIAVKLEAAGFKEATFWLNEQMKYDLAEIAAKSTNEPKKIKQWATIQANVPVNYLKKHKILNSNRDYDINAVLSLYKCNDIPSFEKKIKEYPFTHFRKSSAFSETRNNVITWSMVAEHEVSQIPVKRAFNPATKDELIKKLRRLFYDNKKIISKTKELLLSYGIKFHTLDRPPKTPVDGKSFMSGENPAIVLTLKYKRLDNFAYNIMHELGHVFQHLTKQDLKDESFFTNNTSNDLLEFEADSFARNELIPLDDWNQFVESTFEFTDEAIRNFAEKVKMHAAIVRGRVCFEFNNYYRRASEITDTNKIDI